MTADLFIEGKNYISVRRASQETGYAQDYIGQLCRQKKIPAKLVGRTWFVDIESLVRYRSGAISVTNNQISKSVEKSVHLGLPSTNYVAEGSVELPKLVKKKHNALDNFKLHRDPSVLALSLIVTLFVVGNTVTSWINYLKPELLMFDEEVSSLALADESVPAPVEGPASSLGEGMVVFPKDENADEKIENIKNSFSDEVEVFFDEGGESGVIRPVFRTSGDTDDYAFVMVPVKEKK